MFDAETFIHLFTVELKKQLPLAIDAINLEKNPNYPPTVTSAPILDKFSDGAYIDSWMDSKAKNYRDLVFIELVDFNSVINGDSTATNLSIEVDLLIAQRSDKHDQKRVLRYQRALTSALIKCWGVVGVGYDKPEITTLDTVDLQMNNTSHYHKAVGLNLASQ